MRATRLVLALTVAAGCARPQPVTPPATTTPAPAVALPTLDGRAVYASPLDADMAAYLDAVNQQLADAPPAELGPAQLGTWLRRRVAELRRLQGMGEPFASRGADAELFSAVGYASVATDLHRRVVELPLPATMQSDPELRAAWQDALSEHSRPIAGLAAAAWERCAREIPRVSAPLRAWEDVCQERATTSREAAGTGRAQNAPLPTECTAASEHVPPTPEAPAPTMSAPMEFALAYTGGVTMDDASRAAVLAATRRRVRLPRGARWVPQAEVDAAQALAAQRRWTADGPVCGQAPPWPAIVAARHPHLVVASVSAHCWTDAPCELSVSFRRAGDHAARQDLPETLRASFETQPTTPAGWSAAAARLGPQRQMAVLAALSSMGQGGLANLLTSGATGGIGGIGSAANGSLGGVGLSLRGGYFRVVDLDRVDPWMHARQALSAPTVRRALAACVREGVSSYRVSLTVSPAGAVDDVTVTPRTVSPLAPDATGCLAQALRATAWPCPRSNAATPVEVTLCVGAR
ncbi:MAG: hypothetical protein R3A52_02030 [Polyangiales bacterium]